MFALPSLRQGIDVGQNRFKELRQCPPEKARRWRRAIRSATIEVMQDSPNFVSPLGQATMIVMPLRQIAIAPFDSRRGTLKSVDSVGRPLPPSRPYLGGLPLRASVLVKLGADDLQCLYYLGLS